LLSYPFIFIAIQNPAYKRSASSSIVEEHRHNSLSSGAQACMFRREFKHKSDDQPERATRCIARHAQTGGGSIERR
jgi:hypothetical protein